MCIIFILFKFYSPFKDIRITYHDHVFDILNSIKSMHNQIAKHKMYKIIYETKQHIYIYIDERQEALMISLFAYFFRIIFALSLCP